MNNNVDIVITWVDGSDPNWLAEKKMYTKKSNNVRYRDWDNLVYIFRGIEQFMPWVHKIYFVTWGHLPKWLNIDNEKLVIVNHQDYIPEKYLPTFNSIGRVWRGDEVYWERRTDSVLSNSEYYLNGREVKSLSNFCLYKAKNFSSNTLEFIDDSLVFNNNDELLIKCPKKSIEQIVIYGFIGSECERGRINLTLNNGFSRSFDFISKYGSPFNINIPRQNDIVWMRFHFSSKNKCKISRIEGFAEKQMNNSIIKPYIKILIDDNFTNHYYIPSKNRVLTVDLYRFKVEDSVNLKIVQGKADIINKNQIKILSLKKPIILRASCDSEPIYDQVTISKENNVVHNFKNLFNCVFLKLFRVNSHVYLFKRLCKAKGLKSAVLFYKRKMENK